MSQKKSTAVAGWGLDASEPVELIGGWSGGLCAFLGRGGRPIYRRTIGETEETIVMQRLGGSGVFCRG